MAVSVLPKIEITPETSLVDQPVQIRLSGLPAEQTVTLHAELTDDLGKLWRSQAALRADAQGVVDLNEQAPLSSSYATVDPLGLIWSLAAVEDGVMFVQTRLTPLTIHLKAEVDGQVVAATTWERLRLAPGITRLEVRENGLFGVLFLPAGEGPFPAITIVSGSNGGLSETRGALYAAHGIAALSLAYFAYETLPAGLVEIPLEYFETSIRWLQAHPQIDGERLAISGGSRGGELSLLLGATFPQYKAVVAYVPSGVIWGGFSPDGAESRASWTYQGQPLAYVPSSDDPEISKQYETWAQEGTPIPLTPGFLKALENEAAVEAATISVEKTNGAILLISGQDDAMWPGTKFADAVVKRLEQLGFPHRYQHVSYPNAGHLILAPYIPATTSYSRHPVDGGLYAFGGTPEGNAFATADSWSKVLAFLKDTLSA